MERLCDDWQWLGKAEIGRAVTGSGMAKRRWAMAWEIIEGYAQLRRSNECNARARLSTAPPSSGNELRSNEQKTKKERIA